MAKHPGFKAVAAKIGQQPGIRNPGAVLAAAGRNASPAAKKANPRLNRIGEQPNKPDIKGKVDHPEYRGDLTDPMAGPSALQRLAKG